MCFIQNAGSAIGSLFLLLVGYWVGYRVWRGQEERRHRTQNYTRLAETLAGTYVGGDKCLREQFLNACRGSWIWAPDEVVEKANELLRGMRDNTGGLEERAQRLMWACRRRTIFTRLRPCDFPLVTIVTSAAQLEAPSAVQLGQ